MLLFSIAIVRQRILSWSDVIWMKFIKIGNILNLCHILSVFAVSCRKMGHPRTTKKKPIYNWANESHTIATIIF